MLPNNYSDQEQAIITRFFKSIPSDICASLTNDQRQAIETAIVTNTVRSEHSVDVRPTIGFGKWRYYAVLLAGRDRRSEKRKNGSLSLLCKSLGIIFGAILLFMSAVLTMYLIKSALGIDIFKHFSFGVWDAFRNTFIK
ncbi:hypothetical protein AYY19_11010 [Photobacterium aquimaris]|uniref:3-phosphoshikimate 1-carboxyvinyltransferase n=1 Tax=Photobacterium aquimaris TaxID=512643 RepID=A0A2T3IPS4_9GAMM|nr:hypothetical protein [Photobacterium aquimaris]OBU17228.1 hypothetical protein AYY20_06310 [Photobacterium aquimaris]OBU17972.1 hypothetical protein AYY19_11010 [Photobacterium aquimaris]PSU30357.1 hypothetical protein CTM88_04930 [Photobacterium aquimaris]PSW00330.1 hypothetical protein CTM91_12195 [Photobacterium aquimaris]